MDYKKELEQLQEKYQELQEKYDFLMAAVEHLPNPIFMKDQGARFFFFNKAYSEFFSMKRREYIGKTVLDLDYLPMKERERFQKEDLKAIEEMNIVSYDTSFTTSDGVDHPSFYWSRGFRDAVSGKHGLVGEIVDISKERALQKELDDSLEKLQDANETLRVMAETDHASGLFNRSVLWDKGKAMVEKAASSASSACLIMLDLDNFKHINDTFGHLKGDEILARFAGILRNECRSTDLPVRYGGDEFLAVLNNITLKDGVKVAERMRARCEKELLLPDGQAATVSVGVIEIAEKDDFEKSLSRLDEYMYQAKAQGRNRVVSSL